MITVNFVRLSETAILPQKAYPSDSGFDLYADLKEDYVLPSLGQVLVSTGFSLDLMTNYSSDYFLLEAQVRSKSGLACNNGLFVLNSPGTIDYSYTGEIKVILYNSSLQPVVIRKNQKIAQLVFNIIPRVIIQEVISTSNFAGRGNNGFGSTGII